MMLGTPCGRISNKATADGARGGHARYASSAQRGRDHRRFDQNELRVDPARVATRVDSRTVGCHETCWARNMLFGSRGRSQQMWSGSGKVALTTTELSHRSPVIDDLEGQRTRSTSGVRNGKTSTSTLQRRLQDSRHDAARRDYRSLRTGLEKAAGLENQLP